MATARVQWQRQDSRYQTRIDIDLTLLASLVMTSQGEVTPQGLLPRVYEELRRSGPTRGAAGRRRRSRSTTAAPCRARRACRTRPASSSN